MITANHRYAMLTLLAESKTDFDIKLSTSQQNDRYSISVMLHKDT
jgi:nicotinic acid mononucleotide adenylyltransferase